MIICNHCGASIADRAVFCGECGTRSVAGPGANPYPPPPPPQPSPQPSPYPPGPVYPPAPKKGGAGIAIALIIGLALLGGAGILAYTISNSRRTAVDITTSPPVYNSNTSNSANATFTRNATTTTANRANVNANFNSNLNAGSVSPFQRAEDKIRSQNYLNASELSTLNCWDLKLLRNTFFAQYGRNFDEPELQTYFDKKLWYTRSDTYHSNTQDPGITSVDKFNIEVVKAAEDRQGCRRGR